MSTYTPLIEAPLYGASPPRRRFQWHPLLVALLAAWAGIAQGEPRWAQYDREQRHDQRYERYEQRGYEQRSYEQRDSRRRPDQRPVREAIGEVEHNYRGHVVDVQSLRRDSDEDVYRMRVLQRDGRVKTVTVPAKEQQRQRR